MAQANKELTPEFRKEFLVKIGGAKGKEAILYNGLLALAHEDSRFGHIQAYITQYPTSDNKWTAYARAEIYSKDGKMIGMEEADANALNCGKMTAAAFPRMACTRAKARAFRDFLNVGMVSADEITVYEPEMADPKTIGKIKKIAKDAGIKKEKLYEIMEDEIGVTSFNDLNQAEADHILAVVQKRAEKKAKKSTDEEEMDLSDE